MLTQLKSKITGVPRVHIFDPRCWINLNDVLWLIHLQRNVQGLGTRDRSQIFLVLSCDRVAELKKKRVLTCLNCFRGRRRPTGKVVLMLFDWFLHINWNSENLPFTKVNSFGWIEGIPFVADLLLSNYHTCIVPKEEATNLLHLINYSHHRACMLFTTEPHLVTTVLTMI